MTSKDYLYDISNELSRYLSNWQLKDILNDKVIPILKDLEILELLKSKIGINYIPIQFDNKQEKYILTGIEITKEEYNKIKEYIENGKKQL